MSGWSKPRRYTREEGSPSAHWPSQALVDDLKAALHGVEDDTHVKVRAGVLQSLLAAFERDGMTKVPGASIRDKGRGVTYNVTVQGGEGRVWPRTIEVVLDDPETAPDASLYRLPAQRLADAAAIHLAGQKEDELVWTDEEGEVILAITDSKPAIPTTEQLAELVNSGMTRRVLAARFDRSVATVDGWLGQARRERPDLFPAQRRGPKPQTPKNPSA